MRKVVRVVMALAFTGAVIGAVAAVWIGTHQESGCVTTTNEIRTTGKSTVLQDRVAAAVNNGPVVRQPDEITTTTQTVCR